MRRRNPDERIRRLERQAATGDPEAKAALDQARRRAGLPVLADQLAAVEETISRHEEAYTRAGRTPSRTTWLPLRQILFPGKTRWREFFEAEIPTEDEWRIRLPKHLHGASYREVKKWLTPALQERLGLPLGGSLGVGKDHFSWTLKRKPPGEWAERFEFEDVTYTSRGRRRDRLEWIPIGPYCIVSGQGSSYQSLYVKARPEVYDAIRENMIAAGVNDRITFEVVVRAKGVALIQARNSVISGGRWLGFVPALDVPFQGGPRRLTVRENPDTRTRQLQRAAMSGDSEARYQLFFVAKRQGAFGRPMDYEDTEKRFLNHLDLLGYLGDKEARRILKENGRRWRTKIGPQHPVFGYCDPIALCMAIAAARSVLPNWEYLESHYAASYDPISEDEITLPRQAIERVEQALEEHISNPRWNEYGVRSHARCTSMRVFGPQPWRNDLHWLHENLVRLMGALGFAPSWHDGSWEEVRLFPSGGVSQSLEHRSGAWAVAAADAAVLALLHEEGVESVAGGSLGAIERAEESMEDRIQAEARPNRLPWAKVERRARILLKEAMRRELVQFMTEGIVPA